MEPDKRKSGSNAPLPIQFDNVPFNYCGGVLRLFLPSGRGASDLNPKERGGYDPAFSRGGCPRGLFVADVDPAVQSTNLPFR